MEERANEDEAVGEGEREPPKAAEELLYNKAMLEQELIRTVDSLSHPLQQQQQIPASPPAAVRQYQILTDSQPLPAVTQPLPAASLLVLKRPCEPTSTGSSKKRREI